MLKKLSIKNYKSILDTSIELGRINVFIGENGCGKTNILEALAMVSASKDFDLDVEGLYNRGVRVTKPTLTFSSFLGKKQNKIIDIELEFNEDLVISSLYCENLEDIYAKWEDASQNILFNPEFFDKDFDAIYKDILEKLPTHIKVNLVEKNRKIHSKEFFNKSTLFVLKEFLIYNLSTKGILSIKGYKMLLLKEQNS